MNFAGICAQVNRFVGDIMFHSLTFGRARYAPNSEPTGEQSLIRAEHTLECEEKIKTAMNAALTSAKYVEIVCAAYNSAFDSDSQLKRLETFHGMLTDGHGTLHSCVTEALLKAKPDMDMLEKSTMEQLLFSTVTEGSILTTLGIRVSRCITKHVLKSVKFKPISLPDSFQFTEDDRTAEARADLMQKLENLDQAALKINNIGREFVAENHEDKVLQSLLNAAEALNPHQASTQALLPQPAYISVTAAALYDEVDLHSPESPAFGPSAQTRAEQEGNPGSPTASDFSFIE